LYNQGLQLLLSKKEEHIESKTEKHVIIASPAHPPTLPAQSNNIKQAMKLESSKSFSVSSTSSSNHNNNNNTSSYCVDSVEPKCAYLKSLLDEFDSDYSQRVDLLRINKELVNRLANAKEFYSNGLKLFNDQHFLNMNADRARKYLQDIEQYYSSFIQFDQTNNNQIMTSSSSTNNNNLTYLSNIIDISESQIDSFLKCLNIQSNQSFSILKNNNKVVVQFSESSNSTNTNTLRNISLLKVGIQKNLKIS
jgi:hypothetical protein